MEQRKDLEVCFHRMKNAKNCSMKQVILPSFSRLVTLWFISIFAMGYELHEEALKTDRSFFVVAVLHKSVITGHPSSFTLQLIRLRTKPS
jgi:hypothetical protein